MAPKNLTPDNFRLDVARPDDLVVLRFRFENFELDERRISKQLLPKAGALIIVELGPQSFAEDAFSDTTTTSPPDPPPDKPPGRVPIRIGRPSRLVFRITSAAPVPYTLPDLLRVCGDSASNTGRQTGKELFPPIPPPTATAIEMPYGLLLSPSPKAGWAHSPDPGFGLASFALWHTRLGERRPEKPVNEAAPPPASLRPPVDQEPGRSARAAWRGSKSDPKSQPPLGPAECDEIVEYGRSKDFPAIRVDRLILSALGGWFQGGWKPDADIPKGAMDNHSVTEWEHLTTMGRDQYVRLVKDGFLFPFGHRATMLEVSERKVHRDRDRTAYLRKRLRLLVLDAEMNYQENRAMPFKAVTLTDRATPLLIDRSKPPSLATTDGKAFWPMLDATTDFLFHLEAVDRAGRAVQFTAPLLFMDRGASVEDVKKAYAAAATTRRARPLNGQQVAYVDTPQATFATDTVEFTANAAPDRIRPVPQLARAAAPIPAVTNLTGKDKVAFAYHGLFVADRPNTNPMGLFATLLDPDEGRVTFDPATSGGVLTPDLNMTSLSRTLGPMGAGVEAGTFQPAQFLGDTARLFGAIPLSKIVGDVPGLSADDPTAKLPSPFGGDDVPMARLPSMVSEAPGRTRMTWSTRALKKAVVEPFGEVFQPRPGKQQLWLEVERRPADPGGDPLTVTRCVLEGFDVVLPMIRIPFDRFAFEAALGRKVDLSVQLGKVEFTGSLAFLNKVATLIEQSGFVDPPAIEVTDEGVKAGYTLAIPSLPFGVFNLQNLSFSAFAHLPLISGPEHQMRVGIRVSERQNPFLVTVSAFGGAGFLSLEVGLGGVSVLEASLEFGGAFAMNIGIARGGVALMAGVYYANVAGDAALSGFVRMSGAVEVLGIVAISVQFYLELKWDPGRSMVWGEAVVTVKVSVAFFSKSVSLPMRREFAGSPAPSFEDTVPAGDWKTYCEAFASDKRGGP